MGRYISTEFFTYLENVKSAKRTATGVILDVDGELVRVDVIRPDILRIKVSAGRVFDEAPTHAVCGVTPKKARFTLRQTAGEVVLATDRMNLRIGRKPFSLKACRADGSVIFTSACADDGKSLAFGYLNNKFVVTRKCEKRDMFFGLGEKTRSFNRARKDYIIWNSDILNRVAHPAELSSLPKDHPDRDPMGTTFDPYYISIPFFYNMPGDRQGSPMAGFFIDNGYKGYFEFDAFNYRYMFCGGQYTEYIFAGPAMKDVLRGYTELTGRMQAPPLWALGHHQCRWHAYDQAGFTRLADQFRERKIPCDVLWLDIDYMDGYRVFTWDKKRFPKPGAMLKKLSAQGFRSISIIDPGVKHDPGYKVFDEGMRKDLFCHADNGRVFTGKVWPGATAFPNFAKKETRQWWGRLNAEHVKSGLAGIWNDMNEPLTFVGDVGDMNFDHDGKSYPHAQFHNQYAMLMAMGTVEGLLKAMPGRRTFVLSRSGFAGIQRYAANWMGDNCSRWSHLAMSVPMALGLGISGQPFVGADFGGFMENTTPELLVRWVQCAALTPFFRNHNSASKDQYAWAFGKPVEDLYRSAVNLRYRMLPYIYSAFMRASETGDPIQRPLVYDYQNDVMVHGIEDQYMFGESVMVAPVCAEGLTHRRLYLPEGTWYHWHTGVKVEGGRYITAETPAEYIPVYARGGSVVPMLPEAPLTTMGFQPELTELHVFVPGKDGVSESMLHEDDGVTFGFKSGKFLRTHFSLKQTGRTLGLVSRVAGKGFPEFRRKAFRLVFHGGTITGIVMNGRRLPVQDNAITIPDCGEGFSLSADI